MPISRERLTASHALIGLRPFKAEFEGKLSYQEHLEKNSTYNLESLGLFDTSSPDFNKFYPGLTAEDLEVNDSDFIYPVFRGLSKVIVRPQAPIDFGFSDILKERMHLLVGQAIYPNHEMVTGDELGSIAKVEWGEAKTITLQDNKKHTVPAGINVTLKLDAKSNPRIARSMMMSPPAIHSVSLTVEFAWQKSHLEFSDEEFYSRLGTYDKNGRLVKRDVTDIIRFLELSLVPHGADPYAQKLDEDGNIVNPEFAAVSYSFVDSLSTTPVGTHKYSRLDIIDYASTRGLVALSEPNKTKNHDIMLNRVSLLALFPVLFAGSESLSDEQFQALAITKLGELKTTAETTVSLKAELATAKLAEVKLAEVQTELAAKNDQVTSLTTANSAMLTDLRNEAVRLARLAHDNALDTGLESLISNADATGTKAFITQYTKTVEEKFAGIQSSQDSSGNPGDSRELPTSTKAALDQLRADFERPMTSSIHQKIR